MKVSVRILVACLLFVATACGESPQVKKARHFQTGDKLFEQKQYKEAAVEFANVLKLDANDKDAFGRLAQVYSAMGDPTAQLTSMLNAKGIDPGDLDLRLRIARLQLTLERTADSREELEFVLGKDPRNLEALVLLSDSARTQEEVNDAITRLTAAGPPAGNPKQSVALGQSYLKKGDFAKAESSFYDALTGESNLMEAHMGLGDLAAIRKDFRQAEQEYKAAADLVPEVSLVHVRLADFYIYMGRPAQARQVLEDALQRSPDFLPAMYRLARIDLREGNLEGCSKTVDKILRKAPADLDAKTLQAQVLLSRKEPAEAEKILQEITSARPDLPIPNFLMGLTAMGKWDLAAARTFLEKALDQDPQMIDAALRLAEVNVRMGFNDAATELLNKLLDRDRGNLDAIFLLSESARTGEEAKSAIKRLEPLQFQYGSDSRFNLALASLYFKDNSINKAEEVLKRMLMGEPESAQAHLLMAQLLLRKNDTAGAEKEFLNAAGKAPSPSGAQIMLAEFYYGQKRTDEARKILSDLLANSPDFFPASFALARISFEERNFAEAQILVEAVLKKNPAHADAFILRGQTNLAENKAAEALLDFSEALKLNPLAVNALYLAGLAQIQSGDMAGAEKSFNEAIRLQPGFLEPRIRLAEIEVTSGAFQAAIENLEFLMGKGLKEPSLNLLLGTAYLGGNSPAKAEPFLLKYSQANPGDLRGKYLLCLSDRVQGKKGEATGCFEEVLKASPDSIEPLAQLVSIDVSDGKKDLALERVLKQIEVSPSRSAANRQQEGNKQLAGLYQLLGRVHSARNESDQAENAYLKALDNDPGSVQDMIELVQVYIVSKQFDKAAARIQEAISNHSANVSVLMLAGTFYQQIDDFSKARDAYEALLAVRPDFAPAANNLAYLYSEVLGDIEKATRLAHTARKGAPEDPNVADTLGWVLYRQGNFQSALNLIEESAAKVPDNAEVQFHLGMTHYRLGNSDEAKKALNRALNIQPDFSGAAEAKKALEEMQ